jgi:hypothetical protein
MPATDVTPGRLKPTSAERSSVLERCLVVDPAIAVGDCPCQRGFPGGIDSAVREHPQRAAFGVDDPNLKAVKGLYDLDVHAVATALALSTTHKH